MFFIIRLINKSSEKKDILMINQLWYKNIWTLDIKNHSWVEDTENQVSFIIKTLGLKGNERILDLACGFGGDSLSFASKGFDVTGIDITDEYIIDAKKEAQKNKIKYFLRHGFF